MIEALYIHIPFCKQRCNYCDFSTQACSDDAEMDRYVEQLQMEIRRASRAGLLGGLKTIYIGGGTPTYLGMRRLNSLIYLISVSVNLENVAEFTLEANPDSLTERMVKDLYALGVGRISMGAQSFVDAELQALGRIHNAEQIRQAAAAVHARDLRFSLDLMCGTPGQTMESWRHSLEEALACEPDHLSIYPLSVEENTPFGRAEITVSDELQADMMEEAERVLTAAGFARYEVASYAKPGCESLHNQAYWQGKSYLGLGEGAASMLAPEEFAACQQARLLAASEELPAEAARVRVQNGEVEALSAAEAAAEDLMLAFRLTKGATHEQIAATQAHFPRLAEELAALEQKGLIEKTPTGFAPTHDGWLNGNEIFAAIWNLAA